MKIYSELTKKFYDSVPECLEAEDEHKAILEKNRKEREAELAHRKARAAEVEEARKALLEARDRFNKVLNDFCRDYGSYHLSVSEPQSLSDYIRAFIDLV